MAASKWSCGRVSVADFSSRGQSQVDWYVGAGEVWRERDDILS